MKNDLSSLIIQPKIMSAPIWGTGKIYVPIPEERENSYFGLYFSTAFSSFKTRKLAILSRTYIISNDENANRNLSPGMHNKLPHKGLDLIKWEYQFGGSHKCLVIKTRYIIILQRKIRKFINDWRVEKFQKYLLKMFNKTLLYPDLMLRISEFII